MTDRPIIFSAPMILALLAGRKTMTRRLAWGSAKRKIVPLPDDGEATVETTQTPSIWQRVKSGDRIWVRENIAARKIRSILTGKPLKGDYWEALYEADKADVLNEDEFNLVPWWKHAPGTLPCIYMPRYVSRLTLIVTTSKIERVQDICHADAVAEGVEKIGVRWKAYAGPKNYFTNAVASFGSLWVSLHGVDAWNENPEVVAVSFRVVKANIDAPETIAA